MLAEKPLVAAALRLDKLVVLGPFLRPLLRLLCSLIALPAAADPEPPAFTAMDYYICLHLSLSMHQVAGQALLIAQCRAIRFSATHMPANAGNGGFKLPATARRARMEQRRFGLQFAHFKVVKYKRGDKWLPASFG